MIEPKLRFKADDGSQFPDWEEKTLGDIGTAKMCKRVLKEQTSEKGDVPFYKIGTFGGTPDAFISRELYEELKTKYSFPRKGNILLSAAGTIGRTVVYDGQDAFFQDSNIVWLDNDDSVLDGFLLQFYNKTSWDNLEGGTIKRLYNGLFLSKVIHVPSIPEQQKIVEFLSTVDTVIEKQKETVATWEERKKGVMQKLFSQEVRFKADDGSDFPDWEEKLYLSICNVFADGDWIKSKDQSDSGIRLIQTGNIGNGIFIDKDDKKKYISKETFDSLKCNEVFEGDILISRLPSPAGRACIVPKLNERMITAVDCTIVRTDKSIILHDYCVQFMQSSKHFYYVASMMAGGTRQRISRKNLEDELISVPCLAEQQKIADCLSSLDDVIEKQKATLAAWEELKKGLLQQMFV